MVDSVVNQEPADLQAILYSKSLPVLSNMLAPELQEGKANNYKIVGVERARGFSLVKIKITKSVEVDIDEAADDQTREVTVEYEHHSLQEVLDHFLGKGVLSVPAFPANLDDVNELILEKTDKLILDDADVQAYFSGDIVDLYVKDPLDLRWYGNARLKFQLADEVEGGEEEPGKISISGVVYDRTLGLLTARVKGTDEVTLSTSTGISSTVAITNELLSYQFDPILPGGTVVNIDVDDVHAEIKTPSELTYFNFNRNSNELMVNISGDVETISVVTSYGYSNSNVPVDSNGIALLNLPNMPATSFDITITVDGNAQTITTAEANATGIDIVGIPYEVTVGDVIDFTVVMEPLGISPKYNVSTDSSKYTVDKLNNTVTIVGTGFIDITFQAVNGFDVSKIISMTSKPKPKLTAIAFVTSAEQTHTDGELNVPLEVAGTPTGAVVPNVVYTITESSEGLVAVITGSNTLEATGVVAGSTIKVRAAVTVDGNEISTEQTFTVSDYTASGK